MGDTFMREDITGTLPEQIRRVETFLRDVLRKGVTLGGSMARSEQYEYPLEAVRELVVNAVAHRDYSIQGDGIRLYVFKDRMEITSPGRLPGPVTVANIKDERFSRNPAIVQVLADLRFIERLGYGVDRVLARRDSTACPKPCSPRRTAASRSRSSTRSRPRQPPRRPMRTPTSQSSPIRSICWSFTATCRSTRAKRAC
ncbi:MAG: hypothetical protein HND48_12835 [Chloroflexi bacterium]|nr:hypothetical protein [Chloroflexota bacterium]